MNDRGITNRMLLDLGQEKQEEKSDEEILFSSLKNPALFEVLVDKYEQPFQNKVRSILGPREEIFDIVQETFVKIYMNAAKFQVQEGASFKSWGYKILINTTFTYYQKLKKDDGALVRVERELYEAFPDERHAHKTHEMTDFVASTLSRMPQHLSKVLKLHFLDGMPQKEIASLLGVSISAVKTRIHRAKREYKKISSNINA